MKFYSLYQRDLESGRYVPSGLAQVNATSRRSLRLLCSDRGCRAIQARFLSLAILFSYLDSDTWPLPCPSRSGGYGLVVTHPAVVLYKQYRLTSRNGVP